MSIEKNIERIAEALEKMVGIAEGVQQGQKKETYKEAKTASPDVLPGMEEETTTSAIMTGAELRELAQKYLQASGDKANSLVAFIKDSICKKFSPKEPKLIKIPEDKTAEAAAMIVAWSKKNGVSLPIEV